VQQCKEKLVAAVNASLAGLSNLDRVYPQLESAWFQPLSLTCDVLVSKFAFKFNVYRYALAGLPTLPDYLNNLTDWFNCTKLAGLLHHSKIGQVDHPGCHQIGVLVVTPGCQIGYADHIGCHRLNRVLTANTRRFQPSARSTINL
jgi:hypothetical protein